MDEEGKGRPASTQIHSTMRRVTKRRMYWRLLFAIGIVDDGNNFGNKIVAGRRTYEVVSSAARSFPAKASGSLELHGLVVIVPSAVLTCLEGEVELAWCLLATW